MTTIPDLHSSASVQHHIDTGEWLDQAATFVVPRAEVTTQSMRAAYRYTDGRGPGEELSEAVRFMLNALTDGHSLSVQAVPAGTESDSDKVARLRARLEFWRGNLTANAAHSQAQGQDARGTRQTLSMVEDVLETMFGA